MRLSCRWWLDSNSRFFFCHSQSHRRQWKNLNVVADMDLCGNFAVCRHRRNFKAVFVKVLFQKKPKAIYTCISERMTSFSGNSAVVQTWIWPQNREISERSFPKSVTRSTASHRFAAVFSPNDKNIAFYLYILEIASDDSEIHQTFWIYYTVLRET